ncbi:MAG: TusE/DsrC/DsvC family sulfur relay protein [Pseudohongiellaceae bacterium]|nr:TusE/DsrC/DsvC family sulfur relay protein [Pseudohongiellaceae bacterium]
MQAIVLNDKRSIPVDKDGYLRHLDDWSVEVAEQLAKAEGIELSQAHWEVLTALQEFYAAHGLSPAMRPLVKLVSQQLGADKGRSLYLMKLFPGNPALIASKIAGLPRPTNCF